MSNTHSIAFLLNIQDPNIVADDQSIRKAIIKNKVVFIIDGFLSFNPDCCPHCVVSMTSISFISMVRHVLESNYLRSLVLPHVWTYISSGIYVIIATRHSLILHLSSNCFISNHTKQAIALDAKQKISERDIASRNNVSHMSVNRIINSYYTYQKMKRSYLPQHLCFDAFRSVKEADGAMSFIFMNALNSQIIDIVENRQLNHLLEYFRLYS